jgi:hypothetical protein
MSARRRRTSPGSSLVSAWMCGRRASVSALSTASGMWCRQGATIWGTSSARTETCPVAVFVGFPLTAGIVISIVRYVVANHYLHIQSPSLATFLKLWKLSSRPSCVASFFSSTMTCSRCVSRSMSRNISLELSARTERILPDAASDPIHGA